MYITTNLSSINALGGEGERRRNQHLTWYKRWLEARAADPGIALRVTIPLHCAPHWQLMVLSFPFRTIQGKDGADGEISHSPGRLGSLQNGEVPLVLVIWGLHPRGEGEGAEEGPTRKGPGTIEPREGNRGHS